MKKNTLQKNYLLAINDKKSEELLFNDSYPTFISEDWTSFSQPIQEPTEFTIVTNICLKLNIQRSNSQLLQGYFRKCEVIIIYLIWRNCLYFYALKHMFLPYACEDFFCFYEFHPLSAIWRKFLLTCDECDPTLLWSTSFPAHFNTCNYCSFRACILLPGAPLIPIGRDGGAAARHS